MGPGYGNSSQYRQSQKPLDEKGAQEIAENYLQSVQNPNLKLGNIKDTGQAVFEVEIVTKKLGNKGDGVKKNILYINNTFITNIFCLCARSIQ